jgi:hypothetical protein
MININHISVCRNVQNYMKWIRHGLKTKKDGITLMLIHHKYLAIQKMLNLTLI